MEESQSANQNHQSFDVFSQGENQSQLLHINPTKILFKKGKDTEGKIQSKISTIEECAKLAKDKKNIVILTGMGISVASGIPVVRGEGRIEDFKKNGREYTHEEMGMYEFYKNNKDVGWEYLLSLYGIMQNKEPNVSHLKIQELINFCKEKNDGHQQKVVLVTQNVDGLHVSAYDKYNQTNLSYQDQNNKNTFGYCPDVFEIHGNKNYIRCDNPECEDYQNYQLQPLPQKYDSYQDFKCRTCQQQARSHALYYDENQDSQHYRMKELNEATKGRDLIICIGTTLETFYAYWLINDAIEKNVPIIEINLYPVMEIGSHTLKGRAEEIMPSFIDEIIKQKQ